MKLVVGLGNPGPEYRFTRHNLGFRVLNGFQKEHRFSEFKNSKKFKSLLSRGLIRKEGIFLAKPQTFMNSSGKAVKLIVEAYQVENSNIIVVHDDIDIELGEIKIVKDRGSAGHKGVQSIIDELGEKNFVRLRVGVNPQNKSLEAWKQPDLQKFVLKRFTKPEERVIKNCFPKYLEVLYLTLINGWKKAMNKFN